MNFDNKTLAVFGDSIMYGSGNDGIGVGEYLQKSLNFKLLKYCVGGARTGYDEGKSWIVGQVKTAISDGISPDYIVFDGFTNDCNKTDGEKCDVPLGEVPAEVADVFDVTNENTTFSQCFAVVCNAFRKYFPDAKILFIRPHKMGRRDRIEQKLYGERAVSICGLFGIPVADVYADCSMDTFNAEDRDMYTADTYGWGRGDCTHPNARGYTEIYLPYIIKKLNNI